MKILQLIIFTMILTYVTARVVGPQLVDSRKKSKPQNKQEDDEGVIVDPVITVSDIQVYENTSPSTTASVEENSVELSSSASSESTASSEVVTPVVNEDDANPINRYCKCTSFECDCCREFSLPLVPIRGPGCANIRYLEGDRMSVGIKFGNRVLANRIISGRKETPVCLPLPGGFTNFCGRIYGISKKNEDFKACLGLELRADEEVEAALRVSCFSFGPKGLKVMEAEPIPVAAVDEDEDDDDDDIFGLGSEDDEDDDILDDDDDTPTGQSAPNTSNNNDDDDDDDDDDTDYTGLGLLSGDLFDDFLGEEDQSEEPARKNPKIKTKETTADAAFSSENGNEIDGTLNNDDEDDDGDDESGGILEILDDLISDDDGEDDDEEEKVQDEISEEIAENELEDAEEIVEETDETSPSSDKENEIESENDLEEQELAEAVADDDDDDDEEDDDDDDDESEYEEKPTTYSTLSLLGLRNLFSRFFH